MLSSQRWSKADSLGFCEEDKDTKVEQAEEAKEVKGGKRCTALILATGSLMHGERSPAQRKSEEDSQF